MIIRITVVHVTRTNRFVFLGSVSQSAAAAAAQHTFSFPFHGGGVWMTESWEKEIILRYAPLEYRESWHCASSWFYLSVKRGVPLSCNLSQTSRLIRRRVRRNALTVPCNFVGGFQTVVKRLWKLSLRSVKYNRDDASCMQASEYWFLF